MRVFRLPGAIALGLLILAAQRANAQRVRPFMPSLQRPNLMLNSMLLPNSVSLQPRLFTPPFYSVLANRNPLLLASGLYNSPFYLNAAYGGRVSPFYNGMFAYGRYAMPYGGYGYGGYGAGYGYGGYAMGYGGYGGYGYGYNPNSYSAGYSPGYSAASPAYQSNYNPPSGRSYMPQYPGAYSPAYGQYSGPPQQASIGASTADVILQDRSFMPKEITIAVGTTVVWTNRGKTPRAIVADDDSWQSTTLHRDESFNLKFMQPGVIKYHGHPDADTLKGTIIVK